MKEESVVAISGLVRHRVKDRSWPHFICSHCGDLIFDASMALMVRDTEETKEFTVHKSCHSEKPIPERLSLSTELDVFLIQLLWGTGLKEENKLKQTMAHAEEMLSL